MTIALNSNNPAHNATFALVLEQLNANPDFTVKARFHGLNGDLELDISHRGEYLDGFSIPSSYERAVAWCCVDSAHTYDQRRANALQRLAETVALAGK